MHSRSAIPVLLQRLPDLLDRLPPIPRMPEPLRRFGSRLSRLRTWQVFAAMVPAGLMLGLLLSLAVSPEMLQRAGKPYIERLDDGARVELANADNAYPVDPAPFGYPDQTATNPNPNPASIAEAAEYAPAPDAAANIPQTIIITDGDVLGQTASTPVIVPAAAQGAQSPVIFQP